MKRILIPVVLAASLVLSAPQLHALQSYDLAIVGGRVIDPETGLDAVGMSASEVISSPP